MKYALISDIHGNLEALQTALDYLGKNNINEIYCLGDIVGYGPNPNECVNMVRNKCKNVLMGNHDFAAVGKANVDYFNDYAKLATYWTMKNLSEKNKNYLESLPFTHQNDEAIMVHASPTNPSHWYYILSLYDAQIEMQSFNQPLCFIGHSHVPVIFSAQKIIRNDYFGYDTNKQYIINVGSVGQPRDGNSKLSMVVVDNDACKIQYVRLSYNIEETYRKIIRAGLPKFLAERLLKGY
ncbi:MAG: metallophosphoesterase [Caldithrix sp.]|nr:metallophosphoesterase [Caldithrix sp.]